MIQIKKKHSIFNEHSVCNLIVTSSVSGSLVSLVSGSTRVSRPAIRLTIPNSQVGPESPRRTF